MKFQIEVAAENALILYFGEETRSTTNLLIAEQIQQAKAALVPYLGAILVELIPSYASLLVVFDPFKTDFYAVKKLVQRQLQQVESKLNKSVKTVELPVYYGTEVGLDLQRIASAANMTTEQVIAIHQAQEYRVFAIGFAPGFGYLGEVDERIAMPRLASPRANVPKGAVGIADRQTAIYPAASPGGWNLIGRCPLAMFEPKQQPSMPFDVGDVVKFTAIDKIEFLALGGIL